MPIRIVGADRIEPGKVVRRGEGPALVVTRVEFSNAGRYAGKYVYHMRRATEEEQLASDVMDT